MDEELRVLIVRSDPSRSVQKIQPKGIKTQAYQKRKKERTKT